MNRDFSEMLSALSDAGAEYILVGAHAMAAHGLPRATGDMDLWVRPSAENAERVWRALAEFGAPLDQLSQEDLTEPEVVFQIGVVPNRIDILTSVTGVDFEDAWTRRDVVELDGVQVGVIAREDLIRNKRAVGRLRDLADIEDLEGHG
jgi:predicted nucleotidyltransferase